MPKSSVPAQVCKALRDALKAAGLAVGTDTHGLRSELYVIGEGDLARALFEFHPTAAEACEKMYLGGSWVAGLLPRFAVVPASESGSPESEMLEQIGVRLLYYSSGEDGPVFETLDEALRLLA